ncbi:Na+/Ca+ antiporter, CaCA family [Methanohalobium evestigatum Z-7303]|uniref:Na+/Ca+ antiporter, CaCA family n=1 Tax=Methanohalobium evestigatum (strain ATCC BAA-1072 / DSM 3721 / NBRC 107634 / OCM 161 / Z-7303) TaxID=644295 RepID=D7EAY0_METEZ|nr:calcium/sodium antiporter [Methanohalobium evestigatum]ADI74497.1 Na+/Ca+ antiporter, CaCA family [Methanohalobium evestigatum Z-7303]
MIENFIIFLVGLTLLVKGSDFFVESSSSIAEKFGVSKFVIGLTIVSVGTSLPELASSTTASLNQANGIVIGNILGSNIANICLIVGCAALISSIKTETQMLKRDGYIMLFAALLFFILSLDNTISRIDSLIFLLLYTAYIIFLIDEARMHLSMKDSYFKEFISYFVKFKYLQSLKEKVDNGFNNFTDKNTDNRLELKDNYTLVKDILILVISIGAVVIGARYFIEESIFFAQALNVPDTLVGISLVAVGTSLPELMVTISSAKKGYGHIALGNVIGSNITNIFLVFGVSGLLLPLDITQTDIFFITPFVIFVSLLLLLFIWTHWELKRLEGIILLIIYGIFMYVLFNFYNPVVGV